MIPLATEPGGPNGKVWSGTSASTPPRRAATPFLMAAPDDDMAVVVGPVTVTNRGS